jgi:hypothetical protein
MENDERRAIALGGKKTPGQAGGIITGPVNRSTGPVVPPSYVASTLSAYMQGASFRVPPVRGELLAPHLADLLTLFRTTGPGRSRRSPGRFRAQLNFLTRKAFARYRKAGTAIRKRPHAFTAHGPRAKNKSPTRARVRLLRLHILRCCALSVKSRNGERPRTSPA